LLSNIMLVDLDKELEKPGHKFVRYADDCNIYVKTRRAGERVMRTRMSGGVRGGRQPRSPTQLIKMALLLVAIGQFTRPDHRAFRW
jgi:hypothetical protein